MKIEVNNKKEFAKALQIGGMLAGTSRLMPILDCVKIKSDGEKMTFVSTDTENAISKVLTSGVNSDEECTLCVSMKDLTSYVKLISDETFEMMLEDNRILSIRHSKGKFDLPLFDATQFPSISHDDEYEEYNYGSDTIHDWFSMGIKFIPNDELRPQMNGLYMYSQGREKGCCATNGHSLFTDSINEDVDLPDTTFILNKSAVKIINSALNDSPIVKVKVGAKNVLFHWDSCSVIARIPEGKYPNFRQVIPKEFAYSFRVNKNDLLDAIRRIVPMINDVRSKRMILTVSEESLKVKGINQEMGESLEEIDIKYSGEEHSVAYNYTYIQDVIKQIDSEIVTFMVNKDSSPTMVKEIEREDYYYIIMPMSIGEE